MGLVAQSADFIIDDKPYMLVRSGDHTGARSWQEQSPSAAELSEQARDTVHGEVPQEVRIQWPTKHKGFGEPVRRVTGRDYYGRDIDKRYQNQVILARDVSTFTTPAGVTPVTDPERFAELGTDLYLAYGRYVLKFTSADAVSAAFDANTIAAGTRTKDLVTFKDKLYLAVGESQIFRHSSDGTTWTAHTGGAGFTATYFQVVENRLYRVWKGSSGTVASFLTNNEQDPTSALNWAAEDPIGDTQIPVTGLANVAYQLFIAKEDGLYAADIETGRFPSLTPELRPWRNSNNGRKTFGWGGTAFYPSIRGLKAYDAGTLYSAGPEVMIQNDSEVKGRITALAGDSNWLFAAVYNGTDTYILAGRRARPDDYSPGDFTWNVIWYFTGGPYTAMTISGIQSEPRLWVARQGSVSYIKLGASLENPLQDSTAVYKSTGTDYYPAHDGGSPMVDKHFLELRVYAENFSRVDGRYISWYYRLDDSTTWLFLGDSKDSPVSTLQFDQGQDVVGRRIALKAVWTRGSTTTSTPVVRHVEVLGVEYPPTRKLVTANFLVADNVQLRQGTDSRTSAQIVDDLEALLEDRLRVDLVDPLGRERTVLPIGSLNVHEIAQQDVQSPLLVATATFLTVD